MGEMNVATGAVRTASRHGARPVAGGGAPVRDVASNFVGTPAKVRKSGMTFPQNLPERAWEEIGTNLRELVNSSAWWLADWLLFGEATYGWRRYKEAIERTGLDYQTLRNYAWVARRFEHHRRRDSLSFAHHAEVTRLAPPEQDYWLRKAEQQKWSRNELRRAVRAGLAVQNGASPADPSATAAADGAPGTGTGPDGEQGRPAPRLAGPPADQHRQQVTTLTIELSAGQLEYYSKAAAAHGLPVDQWVTQVLDTADRRSA
ncbi:MULTISPECIES: LmbU family transcriptional regulator [unclassified Streptomyces]|uniref:LmbU family transcriptional regulator n=1 Tax=unclassified Streptomyces TaxID=2593676 RepID=UPI000DC51926|nr:MULTISPECIES: LmbU family transcriptional regulator [unclassified Streptomyces]RAJ69508.1 hypothetical protein K377_08026 [Streptomyces sp. PsTaAH-137]